MSMMLAQMGLAGINAAGDYFIESSNNKLAQKIQDYRNSMLKLSAARSENALTVNEVRTRDQNVVNQLAIQQQSIQDTAAQEVAAAAAGVAGNSIEMAARDLRASAGRVSYAHQQQTNQQLAEIRHQKTTVAIQAITGEDSQVLPKPSIGASLLGLGTNLLSIYDSHQPEGDKLFGYNGEGVNGRRGPI